jgi:hypothetical protein
MEEKIRLKAELQQVQTAVPSSLESLHLVQSRLDR